MELPATDLLWSTTKMQRILRSPMRTAIWTLSWAQQIRLIAKVGKWKKPVFWLGQKHVFGFFGWPKNKKKHVKTCFFHPPSVHFFCFSPPTIRSVSPSRSTRTAISTKQLTQRATHTSGGTCTWKDRWTVWRAERQHVRREQHMLRADVVAAAVDSEQLGKGHWTKKSG